ncbi:hypothetical protein TPHA_0M01840 [Tetrapisispora phaffii CBS 4417]|uniref:Protein kinase domain-containing protein n=1 Tax=Tetrapisispora phaffii (strain ATCC 24235 / CBS 4417 / NBRC 1672 / NRRL Y-8282 / UCD 70-5) TaxID=1071381 RepID=G8C0P4_TETPH|nr:hypothetical protein TPHA_0M01840 [Tetrapisispora phaffii CBS 4417]CCE65759.1 hypothetical protein TPHA_0M01840 [Tetrapisispora phaffii CBS 4417]
MEQLSPQLPQYSRSEKEISPVPASPSHGLYTHHDSGINTPIRNNSSNSGYFSPVVDNSISQKILKDGLTPTHSIEQSPIKVPRPIHDLKSPSIASESRPSNYLEFVNNKGDDDGDKNNSIPVYNYKHRRPSSSVSTGSLHQGNGMKLYMDGTNSPSKVLRSNTIGSATNVKGQMNNISRIKSNGYSKGSVGSTADIHKLKSHSSMNLKQNPHGIYQYNGTSAVSNKHLNTLQQVNSTSNRSSSSQISMNGKILDNNNSNTKLTGIITNPNIEKIASHELVAKNGNLASNSPTVMNNETKRQSSWNEKLYLEKIRKYVPHDYYTRGIVASTLKDDDVDLDLEIDDMIGNSISNEDDDVDFGSNFFTENIDSNSISMSSRYLLHRLEWLKLADPENEIVKEVFKNIGIKSEFDKDILVSSFAKLSYDNQNLLSRLSEHPLVIERFEWQTMLSNVLKGDIVKSEKSKLATHARPAGIGKQLNISIWLELKAWMNGKSVEDQTKSLTALRDSTDAFFNEIVTFKLPENSNAEDCEMILTPLINKYFKVVKYWCNLQQMYEHKPITKTPEFVNRIDTIVSWLNFKANFETHINLLKEWVGNSELDITKVNKPSISIEGVYENARSFAEQIMKEKNVEQIFQRKIFHPLAPWILKAKSSIQYYSPVVDDLNLVYLNDELELLLMFPVILIKEIILIRLEYAKKLENPTMMMIDEMIDDFSSYIRLAVQMKYTVNEYCADWQFEVNMDSQFDETVVKAISYLFSLINLKLLDSGKVSLKSLKEADELFDFWEKLRNVGHYIDKAGKLIAKEFNKLSLRILHRLHMYMLQDTNIPETITDGADAEKWLLQLFENIGTRKRKLNRFTNVLVKAFQNSMNFKINDHDLLLKQLHETGHFLIYTGSKLEQKGYYLIGSPELLDSNENEILTILNKPDICCDLIPKIEIKNSLAMYNSTKSSSDTYLTRTPDFGPEHFNFYEDTVKKLQRVPSDTFEEHDPKTELLEIEAKLQSLGYVLVLAPKEPVLWEGEIYTLSENIKTKFDNLNIKASPDHFTLVSQGSSHSLEYSSEKLLQVAGNCVTFVERKSSYSSVEDGLQRINKAYFRITYTAISNFPKILNTFYKFCPDNELLNSIFLFTRDFGRSFLRVNVATYSKKSVIIMLLMKASTTWLTFLVERCDPTDIKTFRWCVPAMEFAMRLTCGWNILGLDEKQFTTLKQRISTCMTLLISHFDVMGARALEAERANQQFRPQIDIEEDVNDDEILMVNSQLRVKAIEELENTMTHNPRQIGKVLDDTDSGNKYLLSLASSMSNVSIKWQKRQFVGSGTFGTVFSAVNLGNGEILAVKEIKIQDAKAMKKVFPLIKDEMSVLEMLNHPNIVQYYGIEVHRDKVNLFMEFCEGGSLAGLLEHGRIEDEMVTQMYSLELLEGLVYLHQSGIVHRDIKPENILLDFNGIIKFVDFGAARKIAENNTKVEGQNDSISDNEGTIEDATSSKGVHNIVGTPMYMAPETITGSAVKGQFGADDVWSLGCVILEMITGKRPWAHLDNEWAIMYHVAAGHIPPFPNKNELSKAGFTFLKRAIVQKPDKRATAVELLTHPWIVEIRELAFGSADSEQSADVSNEDVNVSKVAE